MKNLRSIFLVLIIGLFSINGMAQSDITGTWNTGKDNTIVKIERQNGVYIGSIISSDNPKAKQGIVILKDLEPKIDSWTGKMYAPRRAEWYDVEISTSGNKMQLEMTVGFFSKSIEWTKHNPK